MDARAMQNVRVEDGPQLSGPFTLIRGDGSMVPDPGNIALAARHGLDRHLYAQLADHPSVPGCLREEAESALREAARENGRLLAELIRILARLSDYGIPSLPLKGPVLALRLWGDQRLRRCRDIDLLVPEQCVPDAIRALAGIGYRAPPPAGGLIREIHLGHVTEPTVLDLHWNIAPGEVPFELGFEDIWASRRMLTYGDASIPVVGFEWLWVLLCLYFVKDHPWPRPVYLSDLARLIARFPGLDWNRVAAIGRQTGTYRICMLGLALVGALPGATIPEPAARALAADPAVRVALRRFCRAATNRRDEDLPDDPICRLRKIASHPMFRERPRDKLRVFGSLVPLLLRPARTHAGQGWLAASSHRLRRFAAAALRPPVGPRTRKSADSHPAPGTAFFPVDGGGLLLASTGRELYALSPSAAALWCWLEEGVELRQIVRRFAAATGDARPQVQARIAATVNQWRNFGLLGTPAPAASVPTPLTRDASLAPTAVVPAGTELGWQRRYKLLDRVFDVRFSHPALAVAVDSALGHLVTTIPPTASASLWADGDGILVAIEGRVVDRCAALDEVAPAAKGALTIDAVNRQGFGLFLHAAMAEKAGRALLLPARPGSGKTCLSAALARAGFAYCSDEMTLLDCGTWQVRGLPTAMAVKQGAWRLLQPLYPELSAMRAHHRADGKIVKYLPPPAGPGGPPRDAPMPVQVIVLPRYVPEADDTLTPIGRAEALQYVMSECLALRMALTAAQVSELVRWIETVDCYTLEFGNLSAAVDLLTALPFPSSG